MDWAYSPMDWWMDGWMPLTHWWMDVTTHTSIQWMNVYFVFIIMIININIVSDIVVVIVRIIIHHYHCGCLYAHSNPMEDGWMHGLMALTHGWMDDGWVDATNHPSIQLIAQSQPQSIYPTIQWMDGWVVASIHPSIHRCMGECHLSTHPSIHLPWDYDWSK